MYDYVKVKQSEIRIHVYIIYREQYYGAVYYRSLKYRKSFHFPPVSLFWQQLPVATWSVQADKRNQNSN